MAYNLKLTWVQHSIFKTFFIERFFEYEQNQQMQAKNYGLKNPLDLRDCVNVPV